MRVPFFARKKGTKKAGSGLVARLSATRINGSPCSLCDADRSARLASCEAAREAGAGPHVSGVRSSQASHWSSEETQAPSVRRRSHPAHAGTLLLASDRGLKSTSEVLLTLRPPACPATRTADKDTEAELICSSIPLELAEHRRQPGFPARAQRVGMDRDVHAPSVGQESLTRTLGWRRRAGYPVAKRSFATGRVRGERLFASFFDVYRKRKAHQLRSSGAMLTPIFSLIELVTRCFHAKVRRA